MSISRSMYKEVVAHNVILLRHKKEWNNAICSNMDGPRDDHAEVSQRKTNIIWYHLFMESKKIVQTNLHTKQKQTHRHRKESFGYQRGREMERDKLGIWA